VKNQPGQARPGGIEALYPFLYSAHDSADAVIADVTNSTIAKAREIVALRKLLAERLGGRITECAAAVARAVAAGGRLFTFGNGGSATDASAIASTFSYPPRGTPIPAICLNTEVATVTALANDVGFENIFARQLAAFATAHDVAMGISTSGNSVNLIRAFEEAERRGLLTIGLAGYDGGKMAQLADIDYLFIVPSSSVHRIQEAQTTIYHLLWEAVQRAVATQQVTS
jgi:D-sedoheptulose 7-phosphate isomerase